MELLHSGKIREIYADGDDILLVASDRVSVYDVVLPTLIPDKGKILTQLSLWWFDQLADLVPNHVISATDVPPEWAGRAIRCRRLDMLPVECIARGYLAGLGLESYKATRTISGVPLPEGLSEGSQLPEPVFTPTTKATVGHDEFIDLPEVEAAVGAETALELERLTLEVYRRGAEIAGRPRDHHRRHQARVRPRARRRHRPRRRGAHPGFIAVLVGQRVAARRPPALPGQAVRPRLVIQHHRLGPEAARPGDPPGHRQRHPRPLHRGLRAPHRHPVAELTAT